MHTQKGILEVICGPMFSGKSEELIRRLRRARIAKQHVISFKHTLDDRHGLEYLVSHDGNRFETKPLESVHDMIIISAMEQATVIGIDEIQFFPREIVAVVCELINAGNRVIAAGLDRDFKGAPFGSIPLLMAIADKVTKLQAICTMCGEEATMSQRLVNGNPARYNDPVVMIGAQESYQARCRSCFIIDKPFSMFL
jgi:thymidine kinase